MNSKLELISNDKCATVNNGADLVCLGYFSGQQRESYLPMQKMVLNNPNAKFKEVLGLSTPKNMTALDGFNNIVSTVQTYPRLDIVVLNFTSQKIVQRYTKEVEDIRVFH